MTSHDELVVSSGEDVDNFQYWPAPLSKEEEDLRRRAGRLLESLKRIPILYADPKAWENDRELVLTLLRRGCIDGKTAGMLEAPIYHNRQIEDAWLFLIDMRQKHVNRRKQIVECVTSLGASYNWSIVLHGSKKVGSALRGLPPALQSEILEAANATDMLGELAASARIQNGGLTAQSVPSSQAQNISFGLVQACQEQSRMVQDDVASEVTAPAVVLQQENLAPTSAAPPSNWAASNIDWASPVHSKTDRSPKPQAVARVGFNSLNPFAPAAAEVPASQGQSQKGPPSPGQQLLMAAFTPTCPLDEVDDIFNSPRTPRSSVGAATPGGSSSFRPPPARGPSTPGGASWAQTPSRSNTTSMFKGPPQPNPLNPFGPPPAEGESALTSGFGARASAPRLSSSSSGSRLTPQNRRFSDEAMVNGRGTVQGNSATGYAGAFPGDIQIVGIPRRPSDSAASASSRQSAARRSASATASPAASRTSAGQSFGGRPASRTDSRPTSPGDRSKFVSYQ